MKINNTDQVKSRTYRFSKYFFRGLGSYSGVMGSTVQAPISNLYGARRRISMRISMRVSESLPPVIRHEFRDISLSTVSTNQIQQQVDDLALIDDYDNRTC